VLQAGSIELFARFVPLRGYPGEAWRTSISPRDCVRKGVATQNREGHEYWREHL